MNTLNKKYNQFNRRQFLKYCPASLFSLSQFSYVACQTPLNLFKNSRQNSSNQIIFREMTLSEIKLAEVFFEHLFPGNLQEEVPSAAELKTTKYANQMLQSKLLSPQDTIDFFHGLNLLPEFSFELFHKDFLTLSRSEKEVLFLKLDQQKKMSHFIHISLRILVESMLSDPVHGGNTDEKGWRFLNFQAGYPRPTKLVNLRKRPLRTKQKQGISQ